MEYPEIVTYEDNKELWEMLTTEYCDYDTDDVPKHGKGYVSVTCELDGVKYEADTDVAWDCEKRVKFNKVEYFSDELEDVLIIKVVGGSLNIEKRSVKIGSDVYIDSFDCTDYRVIREGDFKQC